MKYLHEIAQMGDNESPTEGELEASENKMFSLAALLKTIGTVRIPGQITHKTR